MSLFSCFSKPKSTTFEILHGDITALGNVVCPTSGFQCIVNAANAELKRGNGVCGAIYKAAGPELLWETEQLPPIQTGQAIMTEGYALCDNIIHAVGPIYNPTVSVVIQNIHLQKAYENALNLAELNQIESIAFPLISTGIYGYPKDEAITVAIKTIYDFISKQPKNIERIAIVCFTDEDYLLTKTAKTLVR